MLHEITIRTTPRPGDVAALVRMHGEIYAREYGFDETFSAYVDRPLSQFVRSPSPRERLWIAERNGRIVGSIAIVESSRPEAQLRWYLVDPAFRGHGLGQSLLAGAIAFARDCGYESIFLWTVTALAAAARLYRAAGFVQIEEKPGHWGVDVIEEKHVLALPHASRS